MTRRSHIVALAAVFALTGVSVIVAAQQRPNRVSDQQVTDLLSRIDTGIAAFRSNFDQAIDRNRINGSRAEDDINQTVKDFKQATDRLRDRVQNRRADVTDVEDVIRCASTVIVEGRDQLDLPRGTELTITSDFPRSQRTSTSSQR